MALSIGAYFTKYLPFVLQMLIQASQVQVDPSNYDMVDYLNQLRESVLEAYTGIIQGLKGVETIASQAVMQMEPHISHITCFINIITLDGHVSDSIASFAIGLIGDLCCAFGSKMLPYIHSSIKQFIVDAKTSRPEGTRKLALWAFGCIKKLESEQRLSLVICEVLVNN